jgi:hypothetical protein
MARQHLRRKITQTNPGAEGHHGEQIEVEINATKMDRVTIQCLATGRASTRSMNPVSISITGTVASVTEAETSAPITIGWKYPRHTIPLNEKRHK